MGAGWDQESFYRIGTGWDFSLNSVPGLGQDRIYSVGVGWDRSGNPLPCQSLERTSMV